MPDGLLTKGRLMDTATYRGFALPWVPHAGQMRALKFLIEHAAAGLFASPGTGKTSVVYAGFEYLRRKGIARRMLVLAPLRPAHLVWPAEAAKWKDFQHLRVVVLHGPDKDKLLDQDADVYVMNFEGLDWLLKTTKIKTGNGRTAVLSDAQAFRKFGFDTLVIDELTAFKNTNTSRFKALKGVLGTFSRRWGLTGSPAPNGLLDLFGQVYCLDQGRSFGPFISRWRNRFFTPGYTGYGWVPRKGAEEDIYKLLRPLVLRLEASDYVDMPELVENRIMVDLPPQARRIYDRLAEEFETQVGENVITAANAAAASVKLRQVASGGLYLDAETETLFRARPPGGREYEHIHDEKVNALAELIDEQQGRPMLVAYDFQHDLDRIKKRFGDDIPVIGGGTSPKRAAELERLWNEGALPLLLGHPASIGHGLNLQRGGDQIVWFSQTYNLELHMQFINRVQRQGSIHKRVWVHYIIARNTVDEAIFRAVKGKARLQDVLLDALKRK